MKIFVSKTYTVAQYDFKRLDEEKAFNTYEKALAFLNQDFFEEESEASFLRDYFAEIVEYELNNREVLISKTKFNCKGEIFFVYNNLNNEKVEPKAVDKDFEPQFNIGDIILIKHTSGTSFSLFNDTVGVVTGIPLGYSDWKNKHNFSDDEWCPSYLVEYIGDTGFLTHCHPSEREMQLFEKTLPSELIVLDRIAKHFKGDKLIEEKILKSMRHGEIYVLNHRTIKDINWD